MSEEHLNLLAILARLLVSTGLGNVARDIPCRLMDAARDLAHRCVRTAAPFHRARRAIGLTGSIDDGVGLGDMGTHVLEGPPLAAQRIARKRPFDLTGRMYLYGATPTDTARID